MVSAIDDRHQHHRLCGGAAEVDALEAIEEDLVDERALSLPGPPWVAASMIAKVSKNA